VSQDNVPNKPVHLIYLCGGLILFYVLQWTGDWIWGYFTRTPNEFDITVIAGAVSLALAVFLYRHERAHTLVVEVAAECKKVTWPDAKDVRSATIVVIIMTIISAIILGVFDLVWSEFTKLIYGG